LNTPLSEKNFVLLITKDQKEGAGKSQPGLRKLGIKKKKNQIVPANGLEECGLNLKIRGSTGKCWASSLA